MKNSSRFIQFAIEHGVLQFGEFTLKSGRVSPYFFNAGLFNDGHALDKLSRFYAQAIVDAKLDFEMLFGPAYKGIPLVAAVTMTLAREHGRNYPYAFNRKEAKQYGDRGITVGAKLGGRVLIIDDVITAGTAINEAVGIIRDAGALPVGVVIAFDRQEIGSSENTSAVHAVEQKYGIKVVSVATANELIHYAESNELYPKELKNLREYLDEHQAI